MNEIDFIEQWDRIHQVYILLSTGRARIITVMEKGHPRNYARRVEQIRPSRIRPTLDHKFYFLQH
jgi:hypothetical protein|nr:MAG TPA: hypothetical protein [Caudoviricetes sp.]